VNKKILVFLVVALILATIHLAEAQQPKSKIGLRADKVIK